MEQNKEPKPVKPLKKEETVVVNKAALEAILADQKRMNEELTKLNAVADKSRLAWYEERQPNRKQLSRVSVASYPTKNGFKFIKGWTNLPVNEMYQDSNGVWHERQIMKLILDDDSELDINYVDFVRRKKSAPAEVVGRFKDETSGDEILKVVLLDDRQKQFDISSTFVNV